MHYPGATFIYTDGSKCHEKTASAYCFDDVRHGVCITNHASVFTAELYAIKLALLRIQQMREQNTFVICSDIPSALQSLQNNMLHNQLVAEVLPKYNAIRGRQLTFLWIPSHVGIHGNELADTLAKFALHRDVIVDVKLPFETCDLSLRLTSLGCGAQTGKTTRQTSFNELVPASTRSVL